MPKERCEYLAHFFSSCNCSLAKLPPGALEELDMSLCSVSAKAAPQLLQLPLRQLQLLGSAEMDAEELRNRTAFALEISVLTLACRVARWLMMVHDG